MPLPTSPTSRPGSSPPARSWREALAERQPVEYTPANSIYEQDARRSSVPGLNGQTFRRLFNGVLHLVVASMLLAIMVSYVLASEPKSRQFIIDRNTVLVDVDTDHLEPAAAYYRDSQCRALAIAVVALATVDMAIDLVHTILLCLPWSANALVPRVLLGMGYLAVFMAHIGLRKVFPPGYTYWGLKPEYAGPVVYLFLWALGVWDMLHACIHRHQIGTDTRVWRDAFAQWRETRRAPPGPTAAEASDGATRTPEVTQVDLEARRESASDSTSRESENDEGKSPSSSVSNSPAAGRN